MTTDQTRPLVVVDTSVCSYMIRQNELSGSYLALLGDRLIGLSYFVKTELDGTDWGDARREQLAELYLNSIPLPAGDATSMWYNRAHAQRRERRLARRVGDMDLWIIAHAGEYGVPYMSHDRRACDIARALRVEVLTALPDWP